MFVRLALLACVTGAFSVMPAIELLMTHSQVDSPVEIMSAKSTHDFIYESVGIRNSGARRITAVKFGVLVYSETSDGSRVEPTLLESGLIRTDIRPGESRTLDVYLSRREDFLATPSSFATRSIADLGVLEVVFQDAPSWRFDAEAKGTFRSFTGPGTASLLDIESVPCDDARVAEALWYGKDLPFELTQNPPTFSCKDSATQCTQCSASTSQCTMSYCGAVGGACHSACPHQVCDVQ